MGGGIAFNWGVRFIVDFICGIGACAGVISWGDSGCLGGVSESSLVENTSFGSW